MLARRTARVGFQLVFFIVLQKQVLVQSACPSDNEYCTQSFYYSGQHCKCCSGQQRYLYTWIYTDERGDFTYTLYDCQNCPGQTIQPSPSSENCYECGAGYTQVGGACSVCAAGKYKTFAGPAACSDCSAGKYSTATGAQTADTCTNCDPGKISPAGATSAAACYNQQENCLASACEFEHDPRESSSTLCHCCAGQLLWDHYGSGYWGCDPCPYGFYMDEYKHTFAACKQCADGKQSSQDIKYWGSGWSEPVLFIGATTCINCVAGTYNQRSVSGIHSCDPCLPGSYAATSGRTACQLCTAGKYLALPGQTSDLCMICVAGKYSAAGASVCTNCTAGKYFSLPSQTSDVCMICVAGKYSMTGASVCTACVPGTYSTANASACTSCLPGSYAAISGLTACQKCTAGKYLALPSQASDVCISCVAGKYSAAGASVCTDCTAGKYFSLPGQTSDVCMICAAGTYSAAGASVCTNCDAGKYFSLPNQTSDVCISCVAGKYSMTGASVCTGCPAGKYSGAIGLTVCTDCLVDSYSYPGSLSCDFCVAGKEHQPMTDQINKVNAINMCPPLPNGVWNRAWTISFYSTYKNPGVWTIYSTKANELGRLPPEARGGFGNFWVAYVLDNALKISEITAPWNCWDPAAAKWKSYPKMRFSTDICGDCAAGKYKEMPGNYSCISCEAGKYSTTTGASVCTSCPANSISTAGSVDITDCKCNPGNTGADGGNCTACPQSTYKPLRGSGACTECATTHPNTAHALTGEVNSTNCVCDAGYTQNPIISRIVSGDCDPLLNGQYEALESQTSTSGWPKWQKITNTITFQLLCTPFGGSDRFVIIEPVNTWGGYDYLAYSEQTGCQMDTLQMWQCPDVLTRNFRRSNLRVESKVTLTACESCPEGTYKIPLGNSLCLSCSGNSTSRPASTNPSACVCNAGYAPMRAQTSATPVLCSACTAGKFKNATSRAPSSATSDQYIESEKCVDCDAGLYAAIRV